MYSTTIPNCVTPEYTLEAVMDYFPYGKILRAFIKTPEKYVTTHHERDKETGLDYRGARFYDGDACRFLSLDPLASEFPEWSDYNYVLGNPVRYTDPDGRSANDVIEIEKSSGNIKVTKAKGEDIVKLVDNGKTIDSYEYGKNGSFSKENKVIKGPFKDYREDAYGNIIYDKNEGTAIVSNKTEKLQKFYEFAAESDVEFGKLDLKSKKNGKMISILTTTHDKEKVGNILSIVNTMNKNGKFEGVKFSHSHPGNVNIPSGYYDADEDNDASLMPEIGGKGDAANARTISNPKAFENFKNTTFELYNPKKNTITTYDGVNQAEIIHLD